MACVEEDLRKREFKKYLHGRNANLDQEHMV